MHAINRTKEVVIISVARMEIKPFAPASMDMNWKRMVNPVYSVSGTLVVITSALNLTSGYIFSTSYYIHLRLLRKTSSF